MPPATGVVVAQVLAPQSRADVKEGELDGAREEVGVEESTSGGRMTIRERLVLGVREGLLEGEGDVPTEAEAPTERLADAEG